MNVHFKYQMKYIIHNRAWGNMNEKKKKYFKSVCKSKRGDWVKFVGPF